MSAPNPLRAFAKKANTYPHWLRQKMLTWMFRYKVKLTGTVSIDILEKYKITLVVYTLQVWRFSPNLLRALWLASTYPVISCPLLKK